MTLIVLERFERINFAAKEQSGRLYIEQVWPAVLGSAQVREQQTASPAQTDGALMNGAKAFNAEQALAAFQSASGDSARLSTGRALITAVADGSNLTLDPDLDSFYAMDAITVRLPALLESAAGLHKAISTGAGASEIAVALDRVKATNDAAKGSLNAAIGASKPGEGQASLQSQLARLDPVTQALIRQGELAMTGAPVDITPAHAAFATEMQTIWSATSAELGRLLDNRIQGFYRELAVNLGIVFAILALATWFAVYVARGLRKREEADAKSIFNLKAMASAMDQSQARIEFDLDGAILEANENFLNTMGYSAGEVVGRKHVIFVDPAYARSPEYAGFWQRLRAGEAISDVFTRFAKGGRKVIIQARYTPLMGEDGKPYRVVKYASDITAAEIAREESEAERAQRAQEQAAVVTSLASALSSLSEGNLQSQISETFPADYEQLRKDFNAAVASLSETLGQVRTGSDAMRTGADEIAHASDDLSRRTEQQAASLEETAAALDEITATVKTTAAGARRASETVALAKSEAVRSGEVVAQAVQAMGDIKTSSQEISQIIGVIDEIAFQTNLLALNAGVEAARAGDAGRGFAVVAQEVRALAQRSAQAAKEIKSLISASSQQVGQGVELVGETGRALDKIVAQVADIDALISEIAASAQEQATGLAEVNTAVNQMDQVVQQNAAMVEQSTAATHALKSETAELNRLISRFRTGAVQGSGRPAPQPATPDATPRPSPARAATRRIAETFGATALKSAEDGWEEF
ncbi:MAG: methyl-accepting chemotaxis protein [Phenylobacterium sp.]|uniref:methyl-accepting chemotaxis protein n=1 Tax=Phenylobacterium sp. TaxID=1871053 RepID=UPI0025FB851A|nr:methyl-accepting chemotaxis protein [Phenylobacterium sp.]MCE2819614.1 methyl-accepting chemotaxis protein [Phenylobacterium sp.]